MSKVSLATEKYLLHYLTDPLYQKSTLRTYKKDKGIDFDESAKRVSNRLSYLKRLDTASLTHLCNKRNVPVLSLPAQVTTNNNSADIESTTKGSNTTTTASKIPSGTTTTDFNAYVGEFSSDSESVCSDWDPEPKPATKRSRTTSTTEKVTATTETTETTRSPQRRKKKIPKV